MGNSTDSQARTVYPTEGLSGTLRVPGDKSISHRMAMLAGLAEGTTRISGFLQAEDCVNTVKAMQAYGAHFTFNEQILEITGMAGAVQQPSGPVDLGNSGTGMRLLAGLASGFPVVSELTGDASLSSRPMRRIADPLKLMGVEVELLGENGTPPIRIHGGKVQPITYDLPVASAQVKSCVLLAGLFAEGRTRIIEPAPCRDHTETLFQALGLNLSVKGNEITLDGYGPRGPVIQPGEWVVPGDFSSAAFWIMGAAVRPGSSVTIENVGLNPRRTALLDVLQRMGAGISVTVEEGAGREPRGMIQVQGRSLTGTELRPEEIPNLVDEIPLVAAAGALAEGTTVIRHAKELRVKESDRISSMVTNLRKLGVTVAEFDDGLEVTGPVQPQPEEVLLSYGDHRIAMTMAMLAQHASAPAQIDDVACINTSYPEFWNDLKALGGHIA